jgi:hypothetical protein
VERAPNGRIGRVGQAETVAIGAEGITVCG